MPTGTGTQRGHLLCKRLALTSQRLKEMLIRGDQTGETYLGQRRLRKWGCVYEQRCQERIATVQNGPVDGRMVFDRLLLLEGREIEIIGTARVCTTVEEIWRLCIQDEITDEREDSLSGLFGGARNRNYAHREHLQGETRKLT